MALPANQNYQVSATGGAGTSGQPQRYIPGMASMGSSGTETMAQQQGATMYQAPTPGTSTVSLPPVTGIGAPTEFPNQPVTDGSPVGAGANSLSLPMTESEDPDIQAAREYYPILQFWASQPGASQGSKDYVNYLGTII